MLLEAFSQGKKFGHPEANEDSFVAIPGAGYAVIDGVTDRNGTRSCFSKSRVTRCGIHLYSHSIQKKISRTNTLV